MFLYWKVGSGKYARARDPARLPVCWSQIRTGAQACIWSLVSGQGWHSCTQSHDCSDTRQKIRAKGQDNRQQNEPKQSDRADNQVLWFVTDQTKQGQKITQYKNKCSLAE